MGSSGFFLALLLLVGAVNAELVTLTDATFAENANADNSLWFIKFYTSWCPWSQRMAPAWEQLGADGDVREAGVKVGAVDCELSRATCMNAQVDAYPSLVVFYYGEKLNDFYYGDRDLESLKAFALQQSAKVAPLKVAAAAKAKAKANSTPEEGLLPEFPSFRAFRVPEFPRFSVGMLLKLFGF